MPALITHELYGKEVCRNIPAQLEKIIQQNIEEFSIGTSGPDLFFYYNAWPWLNQDDARRLNKLGGMMHSHSIHDFFKMIFEDTKAQQTQAKISYVAGLLCHWALDKETHPFIFNQSESLNSRLSTYYHRRFESQLDYLMLRLIKNKSIKEYPAYKLLKFDDESVDAILDVYKRCSGELYHEQIDQKTIKTCLQHFYGIQRFLYDPSSIKIKAFFSFEKHILKKPYVFSSMIIPNNEDNHDILNLSHRTWHHPSTNKPSTKSFVDMFNDAIPKGQEVCTLYFKYLKNEVEIDELLAFINNQSFETGLSVESKMKYFDCIYEH